MSIGNGLNINSLEFKDKIFINVNTNDRKQLVIKYGDSPIFVYEGDTGRIYIYNNSEWQQIIETEINYYDLDDTRVISDETTELTKTWSSQKITDSLAVIAAALAELQSLDTPPASPVSGNIYYDTLINAIGVYTGTVWKYFGQVDTIAQDSTPSVTIGGTSKDVTISIADASSLISGLLNPSFFDLLNNSTNSGTPSTLAKRDSNGDVEFNNVSISGTPTNGNHLVTKTYVDGLVDPTLKTPEPFTVPGAGASYPTTYGGNSIQAGDSFRVANSGTLSNGVDSNDDILVNPEDLLIAIVDNPGTLSSNWQAIESNRDQATETVKGVVELATQSETNNGTDDLRAITPLKLLTWIKGILPNKGDILTSNGTNLSQVSAGADGAVLVSDSSQVSGLKWESNIIGGNPNYISNERADVNINGASTYSDVAGVKPIDGTGGSANITLVRNTLNPISGVGDFLITKDAANRQGEGVSIDFTIDDIHKAKMLQITANYKIRTGTFATGDLKAFIYDITNGVIIEPNNIVFENLDSSLTGQFVASFPTNLNSGSYRLCFHIASTSTNGWTLSFNDVRVWETEKSISSVITDWQDYTPTTSGFTASYQSYQWRRVGSNIEIKGSFVIAAVTGFCSIWYPTGINIISSNGGGASFFSASTLKYYSGVCLSYSNHVEFAGDGVTGNYTWGSTNPVTPQTGDTVSFTAYAQVQGWGTSGLVYSGDTQRPVFATLDGTFIFTGTGSDIDIPTASVNVESDSHNKFDSNLFYTVPKGDAYSIKSQIRINDNSQGFSCYYDLIIRIEYQVGGSREYRISQFANSGDGYPSVVNSIDEELKTGDVIKFRVQQSSGTVRGADFNASIKSAHINQSSIIVNEPVACRYTSNSGQSIPNTTITRVFFENKVIDTHGAYDVATGLFTAPEPGYYNIFASVSFTVNTTGSRVIFALTPIGTVYGDNTLSASLGSVSATINVNTGTIYYNQGQQADINVYQSSGASLALETSAGLIFIAITKV